MEYQKIINILGNLSNSRLPRYVTRKWVEMYDQSDRTYNVNKKIDLKHLN